MHNINQFSFILLCPIEIATPYEFCIRAFKRNFCNLNGTEGVTSNEMLLIHEFYFGKSVALSNVYAVCICSVWYRTIVYKQGIASETV